MTVKAYGSLAAENPLEAMHIQRRDVQVDDVQIEILYCGVCHSDIHTARGEWGKVHYPVVPGHEIIGRVSAVGEQVSRHQLGDIVGVGCMVDSCRHCASCDEGLEQYCEKGVVLTYGSQDKYLGGSTLGGYAQSIVVSDKFVLKIPSTLDISRVAPLLCAGITTWSPLRHWQVKKGDKVGVIGLGGLGHMGIKLAHAMGAKVVMISRTADKAADAKLLGADEVLLSSDAPAMKQHASSFDLLLNTIPIGHDVDPYLHLLKRDATMVLLGSLEPLTHVNAGLLTRKRRHLAGSLIGGIAETQEMLDFCAAHNVLPEVEMIAIQDINQAWDRVVKADVKYRFVIDMASLKNA